MLNLLEKEYKEKIDGKEEQEIIDLALNMLKDYREVQAQKGSNGWIDLICLEPIEKEEKDIIKKYLDIDALKKVYQYTYTGTEEVPKEGISFHRFRTLDSKKIKFITPIIDSEDAKTIIQGILTTEFLAAADMLWVKHLIAFISFKEDNDLKELVNKIPPETLEECGYDFELIEPEKEMEFSIYSWENDRNQLYYTVKFSERGTTVSFTYNREDIGGAIARDFKIVQSCDSLDEIIKKRKERFEDDYYF